MPVITPPFVLQGGSHPAATFRHALAGLVGAPFGSFAGGVANTAAGGAHGVIGPVLAVTQNGTPNMSVNVAGGTCFVRGTENAAQGSYAAHNDGTVNLAISAADPTNPRRDLIVMRVRDAFYSGASSDVALAVITGTPAASPADPTPPANSLVLARVTVAAGTTSITNAAITDLRLRAAALGGTIVCTSSTRPSGAAVYSGVEIWETDSNRVFRHDGTGWIIMAEPEQAYVPTLTNVTLGNGDRTSGSSFHRSDGYCDFTARLILGTTTVIGTAPQFTLPVAPSTGIDVDLTGTCIVFQGGTGSRFLGGLIFLGGTNVQPFIYNAAGTYVVSNTISATVPISFANGDQIIIAARYRMTTRYS